MRQIIALFLIFSATAAISAETPMSPSEFEAYSTGRTLTYAESGVIYGIEEYLPGRRVRWAFSQDECRDGYWYPDGQDVCFVYEDNPEPQCWSFTKSESGLIARFLGGDNGRELYEARQSEQPMQCLGPDVGV
jgi:hypothetical protein